MTNALNQQWHLVSRPTGEPEASNFALRESPLGQPQDGGLLVRQHLGRARGWGGPAVGHLRRHLAWR